MDVKAYVGASDETPLHQCVRVVGLENPRDKADNMCHCGERHAKSFVFVCVLSTNEILRLGRKCLAEESENLKSNMTLLEKGLAKLRGIVNAGQPDGDIDAMVNTTTLSIAKDNGFIGKDTEFVYLEMMGVKKQPRKKANNITVQAEQDDDKPRSRVGNVLRDFFRMTRKRILFSFEHYLPQMCDGCKSYRPVTVTKTAATFCCQPCGKRRALPVPPVLPFLQRTRQCYCGAAVFVQLSKLGAIHYGCKRCGKYAPDPDFFGKDKDCDYCVGVVIKGRRSSTNDHKPYWLCDECGQFTH